MRRREFFGASAAASLAAAALPAAAAPSARTGRKALVLIGGANRGAYEAGAIQALAEIQGVRDGQPLDFDMICGTSIGALNAFLVATAQYSTLMDLWRGGIAARNVFRLKPEYDQIPVEDAGVLTRIIAAYKLASGMRKDVTGVLDPQPVRDMLQLYVDPATPVHVPLYISTTDVTRRQNQLWVHKATTPSGTQKQAANDELLAPYPDVAREASDALLHDVLFASAAIPLFFDPILIQRDDGSGNSDQYVDGGITQNVPIDVAQLCVDSIYVTLLAPYPQKDASFYDDAVSIGWGTFETMQSRILTYQVRLAYALAQSKLPFNAYVIRPEKDLPGNGTEFSNQPFLEDMWQRGFHDMVSGWKPFAPPSDLLVGIKKA